MRGRNIQVEAKSLSSNSGSPETPCSVPSLNSIYKHPQIVMPPCTTRNSNQEEDPVEEVETDSPSTSGGLFGTPVRPIPPETFPSTLYDALPNLAKAFGQLADSLNNTRKPSIQARVRELDQFNGSDTRKLYPFLTQCLLNFHD